MGNIMAGRHTRHTRHAKQEKTGGQNGQKELLDQKEAAAQETEEETGRNVTDIPEAVWTVYLQTFLEFDEKEHRRFLKGCEKQIGQLERRIARKKNQENHQVLADMKELHKKAAAIGYTVAGRESRLLKKYRHALRMLARLDITFLHRMAAGANPEDIVHMPGAAQLLRSRSLYEIYKEEYMQYLADHGIPEDHIHHMTHTIPAGLLGIE